MGKCEEASIPHCLVIYLKVLVTKGYVLLVLKDLHVRETDMYMLVLPKRPEIMLHT